MRAALVFALSLFAMPALAQDASQAAGTPTDQVEGPALQLRPSFVKGITPGDGRKWGVGLGLELRHFPTSSDWRWGPYMQAQYETEGAWRTNGGVRFGYGAYALEVGVAHRTMSDTYAATTGITLGKQITFGPFGIGYRLTIPVSDRQPDQGPALATRGVEHTFLFTTGWSFDLIGERSQWSCHDRHGGRHGHH